MPYGVYEFPNFRGNDSDLREIIEGMHKLEEDYGKLVVQLPQLQEQVKQNTEWIANFSATIIPGLVQEWLEKNLAKMIMVSISENGYIIYTIPQSWKDLIFNTTGLDISLKVEPEYGHLVISY